MTIFKDKAVVKSWTFWGTFGVAMIEALQRGGLLDPGFASSVANMLQVAFGFLATMGLRRAVAAPAQP